MVAIIETKRTELPRYGMAVSGYTLRSGAPTSFMVRLEGEKRWRRLMVWQFSNNGTCFLRIRGQAVTVGFFFGHALALKASEGRA